MLSSLLFAAFAVASLWAIAATAAGRTAAGVDLRSPREPQPGGPPALLFGVVAALFLLGVAANFTPDVGAEPAAEGLWWSVAAGAVQLAVLGGLAWLTTRPVASLGFPDTPLRRQLRTGAACGLAALLPTFAVILLRSAMGWQDAEHPMLREISERPTPGGVAALTLSAVVLAPLGEEVAFRGVVQNWLARRIKPEAAIVLTAMLFLGVHPPATIPALVPLTLGLGYVYHQTRSLPAAAAMHATFNAAMVALTLAG